MVQSIPLVHCRILAYDSAVLVARLRPLLLFHKKNVWEKKNERDREREREISSSDVRKAPYIRNAMSSRPRNFRPAHVPTIWIARLTNDSILLLGARSWVYFITTRLRIPVSVPDARELHYRRWLLLFFLQVTLLFSKERCVIYLKKLYILTEIPLFRVSVRWICWLSYFDTLSNQNKFRWFVRNARLLALSLIIWRNIMTEIALCNFGIRTFSGICRDRSRIRGRRKDDGRWKWISFRGKGKWEKQTPRRKYDRKKKKNPANKVVAWNTLSASFSLRTLV